MSRQTFRMTLTYDGSAFAGYQRQPGQTTVESVLVDALKDLVPGLPGLPCGGRTDRGVHACGQVVSFWTREQISPEEITQAVNRAAPKVLQAREVRAVPRQFHASFSANYRSYVYQQPDDGQLDVTKLNCLLAPLIGQRCFSAYARQTPFGRSTVRQLLFAGVTRPDPKQLSFRFTATGFLRRQVRVMVATALREARRDSASDILLRLCEQGDRRLTAPPGEPQYLSLDHIGYELPGELGTASELHSRPQTGGAS